CSMMPVAPPVENPTAQALRAEVAVTLTRRATAGLGTRAHDVPFQRSMRLASRRGLSTVTPTAQALVADRAGTPARVAMLRAGLAASVQDAPFQCSINAPLLDRPTAQALVAEAAAMPLSAPPVGRAGPGTCRQAVPFQCSISGIMAEPFDAAALSMPVLSLPCEYVASLNNLILEMRVDLGEPEP